MDPTPTKIGPGCDTLDLQDSSVGKLFTAGLPPQLRMSTQAIICRAVCSRVATVLKLDLSKID